MKTNASRQHQIIPQTAGGSAESAKTTGNSGRELHPVETLLSPKRAAEMLDVSRSQIDRIAARAGWARVYLSNAARGSVRYHLSDVLKFIQSRTIQPNQQSLPVGAMSET